MGKKVKEYTPGDFVFAKVKGFPAWPARVRSFNGKKYLVYFYGTGEIANLPVNQIFDFKENKEKFLTKTIKRKDFNEGIQQIEYEIENDVPLPDEEIAEPTINESNLDTTAAEDGDETVNDSAIANESTDHPTEVPKKKGKKGQDANPVEDSDEGQLVIDEGKGEPKKRKGKSSKDKHQSTSRHSSLPTVPEPDPEVVSRSGRKIRPKKFLDATTEQNTSLSSPILNKKAAKEKSTPVPAPETNGKPNYVPISLGTIEEITDPITAAKDNFDNKNKMNLRPRIGRIKYDFKSLLNRSLCTNCVSSCPPKRRVSSAVQRRASYTNQRSASCAYQRRASFAIQRSALSFVELNIPTKLKPRSTISKQKSDTETEVIDLTDSPNHIKKEPIDPDTENWNIAIVEKPVVAPEEKTRNTIIEAEPKRSSKILSTLKDLKTSKINFTVGEAVNIDGFLVYEISKQLACAAETTNTPAIQMQRFLMKQDLKFLSFSLRQTEEKRNAAWKRNILLAFLPNKKIVGVKVFIGDPMFQNAIQRLDWENKCASDAITIKNALEAGAKLPKDFANGQIEWDLDFTDEEKANLLKEKETEEKRIKVEFLQCEMMLVELEVKIKACLGVKKADVDLCVKYMDQFAALKVKPLMLIKHPGIMETMKRLRAYVGNTSEWNLTEEESLAFSTKAHIIRTMAQEITTRFKSLFNFPENQSFWEAFANKVLAFKETVQNMTQEDVLEIYREPKGGNYLHVVAAMQLGGVDDPEKVLEMAAVNVANSEQQKKQDEPAKSPSKRGRKRKISNTQGEANDTSVPDHEDASETAVSTETPVVASEETNNVDANEKEPEAIAAAVEEAIPDDVGKDPEESEEQMETDAPAVAEDTPEGTPETPKDSESAKEPDELKSPSKKKSKV